MSGDTRQVKIQNVVLYTEQNNGETRCIGGYFRVDAVEDSKIRWVAPMPLESELVDRLQRAKDNQTHMTVTSDYFDLDDVNKFIELMADLPV